MKSFLRSIFPPSTDSRRAVVSYWSKYGQVLAHHLGGLSLPGNSVVRITDCPDMNIAVYCGRKATIQQQQKSLNSQNDYLGQNIFF